MGATASCGHQREALAAEVLRQGRKLRVRVRGASMLPMLRPGDIAEIEACSLRDAAPGDIVLALRDSRFFLHRLVASCDGGFLARGDSMPVADPRYSANALLGKLARIHRAGKVIETLGLDPWSRVVGKICCYSGLARQIVLRHADPTPAPGMGGVPPAPLPSDDGDCEGV